MSVVQYWLFSVILTQCRSHLLIVCRPNVCEFRQVEMVPVKRPCVKSETRLVRVLKPNCGNSEPCAAYEKRYGINQWIFNKINSDKKYLIPRWICDRSSKGIEFLSPVILMTTTVSYYPCFSVTLKIKFSLCDVAALVNHSGIRQEVIVQLIQGVNCAHAIQWMTMLFGSCIIGLRMHAVILHSPSLWSYVQRTISTWRGRISTRVSPPDL